MGAKSKVDYARIEAGWRAGILSPRQLAEAYTKETGISVSHAAISKHFNKQGIPRDLTKKIRNKADSMVTQAMVTDKVTPETLAKDKQIIESNGAILADVILTQRKDLSRFHNLASNLFEELESLTGKANAEAIEKLSIWVENEALTSEDALVMFNRVSSLPNRVKMAKDLADTLGKIIPLERIVYKLDVEEKEAIDPLTELLKEIGKSRNSFSVINDDPEYKDDSNTTNVVDNDPDYND